MEWADNCEVFLKPAFGRLFFLNRGGVLHRGRVRGILEGYLGDIWRKFGGCLEES